MSFLFVCITFYHHPLLFDVVRPNLLILSIEFHRLECTFIDASIACRSNECIRIMISHIYQHNRSNSLYGMYYALKYEYEWHTHTCLHQHESNQCTHVLCTFGLNVQISPIPVSNVSATYKRMHLEFFLMYTHRPLDRHFIILRL